MKNIYFIQANAIYGEKNTYIPYAAGCIAAYCWQDDTIKSAYKLGRFIYTREDIDSAAASMENPYIAAFSCYVWNTQYNIALAKKVKENYPDCLVVFGGHNVSPDAADLDGRPYIDILVHGSGEEPFKRLLLNLAENKPWTPLPNLSFRDERGAAVTTAFRAPCETSYPSPYLEGYFDGILKDDICFSAIIETNRGCPEQCAFCDWGGLKAKVRLFPIEKVFRELEWIAAHKIEYVYCADANFGLFDRDLDITNKMVALKNETGYPKKMKANFTNRRFEFLGEISKILSDSNLGKSQTISLQSLSPRVLENIGRRKHTPEHFRELMSFYNSVGIPTYCELILGLPGETYESFTDGICALLELGQHKSINVYPCELLPNSVMGSKQYIEKFGIVSVDIPFDIFHCVPRENGGITELAKTIISTNTMSAGDWVRSYLFATVIQGFHNLGLTRFIAMYLRQAKRVAYKAFYSRLIDHFTGLGGGVIHDTLRKLTQLFEGVTKRENSQAVQNDLFGEITYEPDETLFLNCVYKHELFYRELERFLEEFGLEAELLKELTSFQKTMIKLPGTAKKTFRCGYDFFGYFFPSSTTQNTALKKGSAAYEITDSSPAYTWADYAREIVWYGRRDEATLYSSRCYRVKQVKP